MNKPENVIYTDAHKYKIGGAGYRIVVFCEYCGQIAFYANRDVEDNKRLFAEEARKPCPRTTPMQLMF
jgi:RNase P subunit RPR2